MIGSEPTYMGVLIVAISFMVIVMSVFLLCCLKLKERINSLLSRQQVSGVDHRTPPTPKRPELPKRLPHVIPYDIHLSQQNIEHNITIDTPSFSKETDMTGMKLHEYIKLKGNSEDTGGINNQIIPPVAIPKSMDTNRKHSHNKGSNREGRIRSYKKRNDIILDVPISGDYATLIIPNATKTQ